MAIPCGPVPRDTCGRSEDRFQGETQTTVDRQGTMGRAGLAVILLAAWGAALGWQAKRVFFPAAAERLALGVRSIPPGVAYYSVFRDESRAGWAQIEIDTLPAASGFFVRDRVLLDLPSLGVAGRSERASEEFLDSSLNLDSLTFIVVPDPAFKYSQGTTTVVSHCLSCSCDIYRRIADCKLHPPATGGKKRTTSPSSRGVSQPVISSLTATSAAASARF